MNHDTTNGTMNHGTMNHDTTNDMMHQQHGMMQQGMMSGMMHQQNGMMNGMMNNSYMSMGMLGFSLLYVAIIVVAAIYLRSFIKRKMDEITKRLDRIENKINK